MSPAARGDKSARADIPRLVGTPDWTNLDLTQEEGFLLSRVDGSVDLDGLVKVSGMPADKAMKILEDLRKRDLITWTDAKPGGANGGNGAEPWEAEDFEPEGLDEGVDIPVPMQKKILFLYQRREELTHYQILGLGRRADAKTIKRTYFKVSKDFHPDTYFRKELGTFKPKIENLFKRVSLAYEVLSSEQKRAAYDRTLPYEPTPEELEEQRQQKVKLERDERLREERRLRMLKRSPLAKRKAQARQHFQEAQEHQKNKEVIKAANSLRLALALEPDNEEYKALLEAVAPLAGQLRAEQDYKRGRYEESMGKEEEALEAYLAAIEANPEESRALHRAAALMLSMRREIKTAMSFCRKAQALDPESAEITRTMANLYLEMGMHKNALREFHRYLQLNPFDEKIQEKVKELARMR